MPYIYQFFLRELSSLSTARSRFLVYFLVSTIFLHPLYSSRPPLSITLLPTHSNISLLFSQSFILVPFLFLVRCSLSFSLDITRTFPRAHSSFQFFSPLFLFLSSAPRAFHHRIRARVSRAHNLFFSISRSFYADARPSCFFKPGLPAPNFPLCDFTSSVFIPTVPLLLCDPIHRVSFIATLFTFTTLGNVFASCRSSFRHARRIPRICFYFAHTKSAFSTPPPSFSSHLTVFRPTPRYSRYLVCGSFECMAHHLG